MLIAVCLKQVPDPNLPLEFDPDTKSIKGLEGMPFVINPADLAAVELAVRLKEQAGGKVFLLTAGRIVSGNAIKRCLAMGADRTIAIVSAGPQAGATAASPLGVASVLAAAIKQLEVDLVLCGARSCDWSNGLVGPAIAEYLGIAQVTGAVSVTLECGQQGLLVQRRLEGGERELTRCALPAVVTVEAGSAVPRYPALFSWVQALKTDIETWELARLGLSPGDVVTAGRLQLLSLSPPRLRTKKVFTAEPSLPFSERMRLMMSGAAEQRNKTRLVEGKPDELAIEVVEFLKRCQVL